MKLNDFFNQTTKPSKRTKQVISIGNETKENALKLTIQELQKDIQRLQAVEQDAATLQKRFNEANGLLKNLEEREQTVQAQKVMINDAIQQGDALRDKNTVLETEIGDVKSQFAVQTSTLSTAQENNLGLNNTIGTLTIQMNAIQQDEKSLTADLNRIKDESEITRDRIKALQQQKIEHQETALKLQDKYTEGQRKNSETTKQVMYWQIVANGLQEEKEDLENTHHMLTAWASTLEADNTEKKGAVKVTQTELKKLQGAVGSMTTNIDGLIQENKKLNSFNVVLKKELARPKYMSMGAISMREGFKMPLASINIRTKNLGNGAPTLLKFKAKEQDHDN